MIILRDIGLRRGSKLLLQDANVTIQPGQRLAMIGANGSGKSSLFSLMLGELVADTGDIEGMSRLRIAHMAQEVQASQIPAGEYVWRDCGTSCSAWNLPATSTRQRLFTASLKKLMVTVPSGGQSACCRAWDLPRKHTSARSAIFPVAGVSGSISPGR